MSRNDSPFDMQIKLLMIGDSGESVCEVLRCGRRSSEVDIPSIARPPSLLPPRNLLYGRKSLGKISNLIYSRSGRAPPMGMTI